MKLLTDPKMEKISLRTWEEIVTVYRILNITKTETASNRRVNLEKELSNEEIVGISMEVKSSKP